MIDILLRRLRAALLVAGALLSLGVSAYAGDDHDRAREAFRRGEILPLTRILAIADQRLPGEVLEVELESKKGRFVYELKILNREGRVQELLLDARDGAFIRLQDDD